MRNVLMSGGSMADKLISDVALVLEGGGFRGMFTAGVLDTFLDNDMFFEKAYGVSAGAAYGISYASRQKGRNCEVNRRFTADPRYFGLRNILTDGSLFGWNFVFGEIPDTHIPLDYEAFEKSSTRLNVGMTSCGSGEAVFVESNTLKGDALKRLLTASSAIPFLSRKINFENRYYLDGGIADSIPVMRALEEGCRRAVVILTRNDGYRKNPMPFESLVKGFFRKDPRLAEVLLSRPERYNDTLDHLEKMEKEGRVFIIRPQKKVEVNRIENKPEKLQMLYDTAIDEMKNVLPLLNAWLVKKY